MEKWQIELTQTPVWLLQTFVGVLLVLGIMVLLVAKTRFGKEFWFILRPCLNRQSTIKLLLLLALMVLLLLTEVRLNVLSTFMSNGLYSSMQDANISAFWHFAALNAGVVLLRTFNGVVNDFFDQGLAIKWSEKLNAVLVNAWLNNKNYYRLQMRHHIPDNIDQRIQQDAQSFISSTIEFVRGMLNSVISSMEFAIVLWGLAGILTVFGVDISHGIVFFVFVFVILATAIAMWIGHPLIHHNYENEKRNGDYRYALIRIRDHAESVAFYHGEHSEHQALSARFAAIIRNRWRIARQSVTLSGFNDMFSNGIQLLPIILQAPRLFAGQIKIGDIQQTVQTFARLQKALSFFRLFYEEFTAYRASLERLYGFLSSVQEDVAKQQAKVYEDADGIRLDKVVLYRHNGEVLLDGVDFTLNKGEALLIQGPSGCGKTSLLRTLAGLWVFGSEGCIHRPKHEDMMFVPQRAYLPQGSLRAALCYPHIQVDDEQLKEVLFECRLQHLMAYLNQEEDWQHKLSPGELQRIAFARIFLAKPKVVLLDEASSALDEQTEAKLYRLLRERLPESMVISIGHRNTLSGFHDRSIFVGDVPCY